MANSMTKMCIRLIGKASEIMRRRKLLFYRVSTFHSTPGLSAPAPATRGEAAGMPGGVRTPDTQVRSLVLYPAVPRINEGFE